MNIPTLLPAILLSVVPAFVTAQPPAVAIEGNVACTGCAIRITTTHTLTAPEEDGAFSFGAPVARDRRGRIFAVAQPANRILVFDSAGRFVRRVGRQGSGPGEYWGIMRIVSGPGDSLWVVDGGNRRVTILTPALEYARSFDAPTDIITITPRSDGSAVIATSIQTPEAFGYPFHLLDRQGRIVKSFGTMVDNQLLAECRTCVNQSARLAARSDHLLATTKNRYDIERWTVEGGREVTWSIQNSPWFRPWTTTATGNWLSGAAPRPTTIAEAREDASGLLWISAAKAPSDWAPGRVILAPGMRTARNAVQVPRGRAGITWILENEPLVTEMVLEVIDVQRRVVLASSRFAGPHALLNDGWAYRVRPGKDDIPIIEVFHVSLTVP
jgi:hypothetical protein